MKITIEVSFFNRLPQHAELAYVFGRIVGEMLKGISTGAKFGRMDEQSFHGTIPTRATWEVKP